MDVRRESTEPARRWQEDMDDLSVVPPLPKEIPRLPHPDPRLRSAEVPRLPRSFVDVRWVQLEARRQLAELRLVGPPPRSGPRPQVAQPVAWQTITHNVSPVDVLRSSSFWTTDRRTAAPVRFQFRFFNHKQVRNWCDAWPHSLRPVNGEHNSLPESSASGLRGTDFGPKCFIFARYLHIDVQ
jgi:hypothetical protein